jgi:hypothetical protein
VQVTRPGGEFQGLKVRGSFEGEMTATVETQSSNRLLLISPPGGECAGYIMDDTGRDV